MNRVWIVWLVFTAAILMVAAGVVLNIRNEKIRVIQEQVTLENRLQLVLPLGRNNGPSNNARPVFEIINVRHLDQSGADVDLYDYDARMWCMGNVRFLEGPEGKRADRLTVILCSPESQTPRVYISGVLQE